jgi:hypothetical protein
MWGFKNNVVWLEVSIQIPKIILFNSKYRENNVVWLVVNKAWLSMMIRACNTIRAIYKYTNSLKLKITFLAWRSFTFHLIEVIPTRPWRLLPFRWTHHWGANLLQHQIGNFLQKSKIDFQDRNHTKLKLLSFIRSELYALPYFSSKLFRHSFLKNKISNCKLL